MSIDDCRTLVVNADCRPLSYFPLSLWSWQEAVQAAFADRVSVLAEYQRQARSPTVAINIPSVVALRSYVQVPWRPVFSRANLFLRDQFRCQYCGHRFRTEDLTFDHVVPRSRGGRATWTNIVTACVPCNSAKGDRSVAEFGRQPVRMPTAPTARQLYENSRTCVRAPVHATWRDYLYWTVELDTS